MASLDSTSTLADIKSAYADNASYAEDGSAAKARAFITACRLLLLKLPRKAAFAGQAGHEIELDTKLLADEIRQAQQWLTLNSGTAAGSVTTLVPSKDFRG